MKSSTLLRAVAVTALALGPATVAGCGAARSVGTASTAALPVGLDKGAPSELDSLTEQLQQSGPIELPQTAAPQGQGTGAASMAQFVDTVLQDVDGSWSQAFTDAGLPYASPQPVILDGGDAPETSGCGSAASPDDGPFYCAAGGQVGAQATSQPVIYIGAPWLAQSMSDVDPANYDFAVASVIAHEFGHHIQYLLMQSGGLSPDALPGKFRELSADCLGGVWANGAYHRGELEDGDVTEAQQAAWNAGSDLPDDTGPDPHGTRQERLDAFTAGYRSGNPLTCLGG